MKCASYRRLAQASRRLRHTEREERRIWLVSASAFFAVVSVAVLRAKYSAVDKFTSSADFGDQLLELGRIGDGFQMSHRFGIDQVKASFLLNYKDQFVLGSETAGKA